MTRNLVVMMVPNLQSVLSKCILCLTLLGLAPTLSAQIAVNEFNSKRGFTDEYGDDVDWIEVFNHSTDSVLLSQFFLSDNPNNLDKWQFPNMFLNSQELITICASGKENSTVPNHWESIVVAENTWKYWSGATPPANYPSWNTLAYNDQSWSSGQGSIGYGDNDDNTVIASTPSLLMRKEFQIVDVNDLTQLMFHADYDDGFIAYLNGVEIMRSDNISIAPTYNEFTSWDQEAVLYSGGTPDHVFFNTDEIQGLLTTGSNILAVRVHNATATSSDLTSNFFLSAGIASSAYNYQDLPNWLVPPVVLPHADFKLSSGETICISDSNEQIVDSIYIPSNLTNTISRGRVPDGTGNWCYFNGPSPNQSNALNFCYTDIVATPSANVPSGFYPGALSVSVTTPTNASTHYTTNGDVPNQSDPAVTGPIAITGTTVLSLKSFGMNGQLMPSSTSDHTYIINETNHNLPVVSIITEEDHLWDWNTGIYVSGPNASSDYPYFGSNFWQPWSRKSRMEYFDGNQTKQFDAEFDLEIHGGWSRAEAQKSFRIDAKSIYTGDIEYTLIERKPEITSYNNFNLRNGGQHGPSDRIQDAIFSRLAQGTSIDRMGYEPCIVYLNGSYWGLYGLREKIDEHYAESNHGVDSKNVQLLNRDGSLVGSASHFVATHSIILNTSPSSSNFVDVFSSRLDIDNYIDYFIFQTYVQNMDWLGIAWGLNNVKLWRPDSVGGKWRYVMYDTDAGFGQFGHNVNYNYIALARNPGYPNQHSQIFDHALDNNEFKCRFTNRYNDLINTTFQPSVFNATTDALQAQIKDAIPDHVDTWGSQMGPVSYWFWEYSVNELKQYNSDRIPTARQHLNQSLNLLGQREVSLSAAPGQSGTVKLNSIIPSLPWDGIYHGACPVHAKAIANNGFTFSHWTSTNPAYNNVQEDSIEVNLATNTSLVAHFTDCHQAFSANILVLGNTLLAELSDTIENITYEWTLNGTVVSTDSILYNPMGGTYGLTVRFDSCEIAASALAIESETYQLHLFPNPATDVLNLQFLLGEEQQVTLSIVNAIGQVVWESTYEHFIGQFNQDINVEAFARELYVFKVETPNAIYSEKFLLVD